MPLRDFVPPLTGFALSKLSVTNQTASSPFLPAELPWLYLLRSAASGLCPSAHGLRPIKIVCDKSDCKQSICPRQFWHCSLLSCTLYIKRNGPARFGDKISGVVWVFRGNGSECPCSGPGLFLISHRGGQDRKTQCQLLLPLCHYKKTAVLKSLVSKLPFGVRFRLGRVNSQPLSNGFLYCVSVGDYMITGFGKDYLRTSFTYQLQILQSGYSKNSSRWKVP